MVRLHAGDSKAPPAEFKEPPRPGSADRKRTLDQLSRGLAVDEKRSLASIAITKSNETRISKNHRESPRRTAPELPSVPGAEPKPIKSAATHSTSVVDLDNDGKVDLEEAFSAHVKNFDEDDDGTMSTQEVVNLMMRCGLFDEWLSAGKVRVYFYSLAEGCNHVIKGQPSPKILDGIGFPQFEGMLRWAADLKGIPFSEISDKVVNESRKSCDKTSSQRRRVEVVFETFCKSTPGLMTSFEFAHLCTQFDLFQHGKFAIGDLYILFKELGKDMCVDIDAFLAVTQELGDRIGVGKEIFNKLAQSAEDLQADETKLSRLRLKLKEAAVSARGRDWAELFRQQDVDNSGNIGWNEFHLMCNETLKLGEPDLHLQLIFKHLDKDESGEMSIAELVEFIKDPAEELSASWFHEHKVQTRDQAYAASFEFSVKTSKWAHYVDNGLITAPTC
mmetsp:Transcript_104882/g.224124  ORF Transcript_104882/g.224124 Transcript_104882/m.224124 type:complete len:446 (-) Transcript_104882:33-1370(-)